MMIIVYGMLFFQPPQEIMERTKQSHHFYFLLVTFSHWYIPYRLKSVCWRRFKSKLPSGLNHNLSPEFIYSPDKQLLHSSTRSNKKLNPAPRSGEVKPSLSSDSSGREGWRCCAKSNQVCSQAHGLTPTDTSSRKSHQLFPLKPEATFLITLHLQAFPENCKKCTTLFLSLLQDAAVQYTVVSLALNAAKLKQLHRSQHLGFIDSNSKRQWWKHDTCMIPPHHEWWWMALDHLK